jgi:hypothetical protein
MSVATFYRLCVWLPIVIPAVLIVVVNAFGLRDLVGWVGELVAYSLFYDGVPYLVLAIGARRVMFRAPLYMVGAFVPLALLIGVAVGAVGPWAGVAGLGAVAIVVIGYAYVGLTVLLRLGTGTPVS